jgi:hypothetical protein
LILGSFSKLRVIVEEEIYSSIDNKAPVSRERLYQEVWAEPMTSVAIRYKVSTSFLARVCTWLNVPRPQSLKLAREMVGGVDVLQWFKLWKAPGER